jgi:hypothetical protein
MSKERFWMVLGNGPPTVRHNSFETAREEAARLARLHRGAVFTVLMSIGAVIVSDVTWVDHDDGSEVPF